MIDWMDQEVARVVDIIREVGVPRLGYWDGCCCSNFSIRTVNVDISCGKSRPQGVWIWSNHSDYDTDSSEWKPLEESVRIERLRPIMNEVVFQLNEKSGRGPHFEEHFEEWKPKIALSKPSKQA